MLSKLEKYKNFDLSMPTYLFHGSPKDLEKLIPITSNDSENLKNIDTAIFTSSSHLIAAAYAFKDTIKKMNVDRDWDFKITNIESEIIMEMENVEIDENIEGFIYVIKAENYINDGTHQYKIYEETKCIDKIKIKYEDFKNYFLVNHTTKRK